MGVLVGAERSLNSPIRAFSRFHPSTPAAPTNPLKNTFGPMSSITAQMPSPCAASSAAHSPSKPALRITRPTAATWSTLAAPLIIVLARTGEA